MPADRRLPLDQVSLESGLGNIKRRLHTGNAPAHNQCIGADGKGGRHQVILAGHSLNTGSDDRFGLLSGQIFIFGHPRHLLTHADHMEGAIGIQSGPLAGRLKGFFMHPRGTRSHHNAREMMGPNIIFDQLLARIGAHEQVITGDRYIR